MTEDARRIKGPAFVRGFFTSAQIVHWLLSDCFANNRHAGAHDGATREGEECAAGAGNLFNRGRTEEKQGNPLTLSLEKALARWRKSRGLVCEMAPGADVGVGTVEVRPSTYLARGGRRVRWLRRERTTREKRKPSMPSLENALAMWPMVCCVPNGAGGGARCVASVENGAGGAAPRERSDSTPVTRRGAGPCCVDRF